MQCIWTCCLPIHLINVKFQYLHQYMWTGGFRNTRHPRLWNSAPLPRLTKCYRDIVRSFQEYHDAESYVPALLVEDFSITINPAPFHYLTEYRALLLASNRSQFDMATMPIFAAGASCLLAVKQARTVEPRVEHTIVSSKLLNFIKSIRYREEKIHIKNMTVSGFDCAMRTHGLGSLGSDSCLRLL